MTLPAILNFTILVRSLSSPVTCVVQAVTALHYIYIHRYIHSDVHNTIYIHRYIHSDVHNYIHTYLRN